jgi:hypothetical protein
MYCPLSEQQQESHAKVGPLTNHEDPELDEVYILPVVGPVVPPTVATMYTPFDEHATSDHALIESRAVHEAP